MVFRTFGTGLLARLIGGDRDDAPDTAWLLFGPTDEDVVEPAEEPPAQLLAAE